MEDATPEPEENIGAMEAAVIASLVQSGVSYSDAKAQVLGGGAQATPEPAVEAAEEDIEPPVVPAKSKDFSDEQVKLHNEVLAIHEGDGQGIYSVTLDNIPEYIFDWVARRTIQEAARRNDPEFLVPNFLLWLLKQERAIDPTKGGTVQGGSSGPKDSYNPITERWA